MWKWWIVNWITIIIISKILIWTITLCKGSFTILTLLLTSKRWSIFAFLRLCFRMQTIKSNHRRQGFLQITMRGNTQCAKRLWPLGTIQEGIPACCFLTGSRRVLIFVPFFLNLHNFWRAKVKFSNEDPTPIFFKGFYNHFSKFLHVRNWAN